ncbi:TPA: winged helix-turn-helix domain-containing protein [Klebsiella aerogenes]|nr:winged helix-turn-helix domain-containing protein [Klebsiella aerogenes]
MAFSEFIINNEVIFDVNMSELRPVNGNGESINLNGPTARCLQLLIESNGRIISREEFLESVWKTRGVVVAQNTFYQNISLLRKSLLKAGLSQDIIVTVRQRGFILATGSLIVPVVKAEEEVSTCQITPLIKKDVTIEDSVPEINNNERQNYIENKRDRAFKLPMWFILMFVIMAVTNILSLFY